MMGLGMNVSRWIIAYVVSILAIGAFSNLLAQPKGNVPQSVPLDVLATITPSAFHDKSQGPLVIAGQVYDQGLDTVHLRVTDSQGQSHQHQVAVRQGRYRCRYPDDFKGAPPLEAGFLFVDAGCDAALNGESGFQAEATVIVHDVSHKTFPEFPSAFTNDLLDAHGRTDRQCCEWPIIRRLVNRYMHSRGAHLTGVGRDNFDLARADDLDWFKNNLTLYEFDYRDRDWSSPLGHRAGATFWQAVWDNWFNASNNHPLDGDPKNKASSNYLPYTFTNDFADILILYLLRSGQDRLLDDNYEQICVEGVRTFLNLQHTGPGIFSEKDSKGRRHVYTDGAFHYGMFEDGTFLTEGRGWFYQPDHEDYINGGVFNGRATWCLGLALQCKECAGQSDQIIRAIGRCVRFCLIDSVVSGYAKRTPQGRVYWYDPGEMGYLLCGMLAALRVDPDIAIADVSPDDRVLLSVLTSKGLDAMVELMQPHGQWQQYGNKDPMVIAALVEGCQVLKDHPHRERWRAAAVKVADSWLAAKVDPEEYPAPLVHFASLRPTPERMSFLWDWSEDDPGRTFVVFYISGHWLHALAKVYELTGDERYLHRCEAIIRYFCGANPWHVRLLNETGGIYNYVQDTDGDGIEDLLNQDMYPESTSFCQIGIHYLLHAMRQH